MDIGKQPDDYKKKAIIALMYKVAGLDNGMQVSEEYFIIDTAQKFGLADSEVLNIKADPEKYPLSVPHSEQERMTILYYLLFLIKFDGEITDDEVAWIKQIGLKFGFRDELTTDYIRLMKKYIDDTDLLPDEMIDVIKKFKN